MSSRTAAAAVACAAALTLGSAGTALAIPLEPAPTTDVTTPVGTGDIVGVDGTGSASLSADTGSVQNLVSGSASGSGAGGTGSGGSGSGGGVPGSGSANFGNRVAQMGPAIAGGIDQLMRALGFRPGPLPACPEGLERTGDGLTCR
ncbi:hypothetical protein [Nocardia sp. IFM 10818]